MSQDYDLSHVMDVGMEFSSGPPVSLWDMVQQSARQRFRVDSELALQNELQTRWAESLTALRTASGQEFEAPSFYPNYIRFAQSIREGARPEVDPSHTRALVGIDPERDFDEIARANEAIRQLNNPNIRTFEQILDEVSSMQRGVEEETASMYERAPTGAWLAQLIGGAAGSFTLRDPLNVFTLPIGAGRTIATRILTDMAVAGLSTAGTEYESVIPNRAIAGLPEHDPFFNIAAATLGAGVFRGVFEGVGAGVRRLSPNIEDIDFDVRDAQMQQMFADINTPTSRAAASVLDDTIVFERSNPYGEGMVAGYRWQAELDATARALNGEEAPEVEMPPIPNEFIDRHLSFQTVKETAPELWNELEVARTRLAELDNSIAEVSARELTLPDAVRLVDAEAAAKLDQLAEIVNDPTIPEPTRAAADMEARTIMLRVGQDKIMEAVAKADTAAKFEVRGLRASRKAANKKYRAAYQKVEAEAVRLEHAEAAKRATAQTASIDAIGPQITSEPMTGPMTRYDFVEAHTARVEEADAAIPARSDAVNDLKIDYETTRSTLLEEDVLSWFGSSKVVSETGEPLLLYHGSTKEGLDQLHSQATITGDKNSNHGIYLSPSRNLAEDFGTRPNVYSAYVKIENPLIIEKGASREIRTSSMYVTPQKLEDWKAQGYDGIINRESLEVVAFSSEQIRIVDSPIEFGKATVDIGTKTPVPLTFKVPFDDGELSVKQILDDLAEDQRLEQAVKGCAI